MAKQTVPPLPLPKNMEGQRVELAVTHLAGRRHLPIVELKKAAYL